MPSGPGGRWYQLVTGRGSEELSARALEGQDNPSCRLFRPAPIKLFCPHLKTWSPRPSSEQG